MHQFGGHEADAQGCEKNSLSECVGVVRHEYVGYSDLVTMPSHRVLIDIKSWQVTMPRLETGAPFILPALMHEILAPR